MTIEPIFGRGPVAEPRGVQGNISDVSHNVLLQDPLSPPTSRRQSSTFVGSRNSYAGRVAVSDVIHGLIMFLIFNNHKLMSQSRDRTTPGLS